MKIGILGGTFNPIHNGHIRLAKDARSKLDLDKVIFIPSYAPPHKSSEGIVSPQDRLHMVKLAIKDESGLEASDIEIKLKGTSYSINTIKELKREYGDGVEIFFIAGSDYADELDTWKDIEDLKRLCNFIIATRPGYKLEEEPPNTTAIEVDTPDISASQIRELVKGGEGFEEHLPKKVSSYIKDKRLYL